VNVTERTQIEAKEGKKNQEGKGSEVKGKKRASGADN